MRLKVGRQSFPSQQAQAMRRFKSVVLAFEVLIACAPASKKTGPPVDIPCVFAVRRWLISLLAKILPILTRAY
jgi:hypothetical protein